MPKYPILQDVKFKYSGLMDFESIYKEMFKFFDSKGFDIVEKKHEEKVNADGSKEIKIEWNCEKEVTDYMKYTFGIEVSVKNLRKVIVKAGELKREMQDGEIEFKVNANLETDIKKMFGEDPRKWFFRALLEKYIWSEELKAHKKAVYKIGYEFLNTMRDLLNAFKYPI